MAGAEASRADPSAAGDLREVIDLALARGGALLTAGERLIVERIRDLEGEAAGLYARLTLRVGAVFPEDRLEGEVGALVEAGLVDRFVPWAHQIAALTVPELKALARAAGLPVSGRRDALVERLAPHPQRTGRSFVRVLHRALIHRLAQWALLRRRPDRSAFVVERLGHVRWPEYTPTGGRSLHATRAELIAWEAAWEARDTAAPEVLLAALDARSTWPPAGLDLRPSLVRRVLDAARARERAGATAAARALYEGLADGGHVPRAEVAVRIARTHEIEGDAQAAWHALDMARAGADRVTRVALQRTGRRLGAATRRGWAPEPPLRAPPTRHVRLDAVGRGARPRWRGGDREGVIEQATAGALAASGRRALHAEGALWTTLFALLFAEAYFLPVRGMLPARFLSGPLDVGTPAFAARRAAAVAETLDAVARGDGPSRVASADARWRGTWLAGASWGAFASDDLRAVAEGVGGAGLAAIVRVLLRDGWSAAAGLPDLVVLPGVSVTLPDMLPARLDGRLHLAEIKGPTDSLRDAQAVWLDRLVRAGVPVEVWQVRAR